MAQSGECFAMLSLYENKDPWKLVSINRQLLVAFSVLTTSLQSFLLSVLFTAAIIIVTFISFVYG
jgi:hypothetical protein